MPADTYSPSLGAIEQGTGNNNNAWGTNLNGALTALDLGVAGFAPFTVTGGTLLLDGVVPPAGQHPLVQMVAYFTGTLTSNQIVQVPNVPKVWLVGNGTAGAFTLTFKTTAGSVSPIIPQGGWALVWCDGSNLIRVGMSTTLQSNQWLGADGTISLPGISFANESTLGLRRVSAGVMALTVGGVDILTISATAVTVAAAASFSVVPPGTEVNTAAIAVPTGWYFEFGQVIARSTDTPLMNAITQAFTATTNGTTTLSAVSADLRNLGLEGSVLEGTGMATNATIVSITSTTIVMSLAATNSASGGAVRAFPFGNGDGSTTFGLPDARGSVAAGRDNMGAAGSAARGKLTTAGSTVDGTKLLTDAGGQNLTLALGQIPSGITSNNAAQNITADVGAGKFFVIASSAVSNNSVVSGGSVNVPGSASGFGSSSQTVVTSNSISVTSNNTGGSTTPVVQPTRVRNVMIKR